VLQQGQGLQPDRAPRLRRLAEVVDQNAAEAANPLRARRLAREMRLRATLLELGPEASIDEEVAELAMHTLSGP
jgi:hypothetical protein